MQNSAAWIVSAVFSLAAHYGLITAASYISLAEPPQERLASVVLGNAALAPLSVSAERTEPEAMAELSQAVDAAAGTATLLNPGNAQLMAPDAAKNALVPGNSGVETGQTPAADLAPSTDAAEALADRSGFERVAEQGSADIRQEPGSEPAVAIASSDPARPAGAPELAAGEAQSLASETPVQAAPEDAAMQLEPAAPPAAANASSAASLALQQETSSAPAALEAPPLQQQSSAIEQNQSASLQLESSSSPAVPETAPLQQQSSVLGQNQSVFLQHESSTSPEVPAGAPLQSETASPAGNAEIAALQPEESALEAAPEVSTAATAAVSPDTGKTIASVAAGAAARSQGDRIRSFMRDYQNKGCIYAKADRVDSSRPTFTGLGGNSGAVDDFVTAFKNTVGVDPAVSIRTVMDAQCPAVDFIKAINGNAGQDFKIVLDSETVDDGKFLVGHLDGPLNGSVHVMTVDDAGNVVDISRDFHRQNAGNFFAVEVSLLTDGQSRNQLVIAILAREHLEIPQSPHTESAAEIFRSIVQQLGRQGGPISSAFAAFKVQ
jgi:hypothetical protein